MIFSLQIGIADSCIEEAMSNCERSQEKSVSVHKQASLVHERA
jgi:hypothetical protein